jgi:hypothetical protein
MCSDRPGPSSGAGVARSARVAYPLYVDRSWIANLTYLYVRVYFHDWTGAALGGSAKIGSFSMWQRSAYIPGKY